MNRRGFLGAILAAAAAPAIVRSESLMKIYVPPQKILMPGDLNLDSLEQMMINIRETIDLQPTKLIVPAYISNLALSMMHTKETVSARILQNSFRMN